MTSLKDIVIEALTENKVEAEDASLEEAAQDEPKSIRDMIIESLKTDEI